MTPKLPPLRKLELEVPGTVDTRHASLTQEVFDPVISQLRADEFVGGIGGVAGFVELKGRRHIQIANPPSRMLVQPITAHWAVLDRWLRQWRFTAWAFVNGRDHRNSSI